jgi:hypothetical protein
MGTLKVPERYSKRAILAKSAPLAPVCEQYVPWDILISESAMKNAREGIREALYASLVTLFSGHWELNGNSPEDQSRELSEGYDDITVGLLYKGIMNGWIDHNELKFIRRFNAKPENARNIALMTAAVKDAVPDDEPIPMSLFWGLHNDDDELDLSTNEEFTKSLALLLYGFSVNHKFPDSDQLFTTHEAGKKYLRNDITKLLSRRPDDALRIAAIVIERENHDNDLIEEIIDSASVPLRGGVL